MILVHDDIETDRSGAMYLDRRRAARVPQARPVKVYEPYASRFFGGVTVDVSSTGMKIAFPAWVQLNVGRVLNVHVGMALGGQPLANRRSMIPARVVWMAAPADKNVDGLTVGIEFLTGVTASAA